jgi:methylated-DNA-[protein]-cysteine S-methyltransferase
MSTFSEQVYDVVKKIPRGKVMTYKQVAIAMMKPRSARAVGNALNKNPDLLIIPCHRVVRSNGLVGGYVHGMRKKVSILLSEGIGIHHNRVDKKYIIMSKKRMK